jgi:uncharacterized protein YjbI with pentapeptide repeats
VNPEDLSAAEAQLWDAFPLARTVDLRTGGEREDAAAGDREDAAAGAGWGPERTVRAAVIAALLLGTRPTEPGLVPALRLSGARITGLLDLSHADVGYAVYLRDCYWDTTPRMPGARLRLVSLNGSCMPGLQLSDAEVDGLLLLSRCRFSGEVNLTGTRVRGIVSLSDARLTGDPALSATSLTVERELVCVGMEASGECRLPGASVGGRLVLDRARLENPGGRALTADGLVAQRGVFCLNGFTALGEVRFPDAQAGPRFTMAGASLRNPGGTALDAERVSVDGELVLSEGFTAEGEVMMRGAQVQGGLNLNSATLRNPPGTALNAGRSFLGNGLYAMDGFTAHGEVQIGGVRIQGSVNLGGASLLNPGKVALLADRLDVTGRLFCGAGFQAQGEIRLVEATVSSSLNFTGATLSHAPEMGINAEGARIGGELCFDAATVRADVDLRFVHAAILRIDAGTSITGTLDLEHATVEVLHDHPEGWPRSVRLNGFTYTTLSSPLPVAEQLGWLTRNAAGYQPQPYEQLATVYRAMGRDSDARTVLLTKQRQRSRSLPAPLRPWSYLQDWMVGYGYRPQRAAVCLIVLLAIGTAAFTADHPAPLDRSQAPEFSPALYTLDLLIPFGGLGQRGAFNPVGWHHWLAAGITAAGWVLATTVAAGITRVLSRQ